MKNKRKGFTLLFAILTAGILLSLALAIFNQVYKSLLLSSANKESLAAFYAADSGVECVFFWDLKYPGFDYGIFATSSASVLYNGNEGITCNDVDFPDDWTVTSLPASAVTTFNLSFENSVFPTEGCSEVTVSKTNVNQVILTTVESRGYNICDSSSPRKVERAIRVTY